MKKALLVGIDNYHDAMLSCCINDVNCIAESLKYNADGNVNFSVITLLDKNATKSKIRSYLKKLFSGEGETALFYFSGHGIDDKNDGFIVSYDYDVEDYGISMVDILRYASCSKFKNKIIILDCCHSGFAGNYGLIGDNSFLPDGVVIMTASRKDEVSHEVGNHGVFSNLLIEALNGGATDILGNVTPGSIYSFIDQALGPWAQRPLFKANISSFVSLKKCKEKISIMELRKAMGLFSNDLDHYPLDPSYEKTNFKGSEHYTKEPYMNQKNVDILTLLQKCNRNGLVTPDDAIDMYFAAMNEKSCSLTPLGKHYWHMIRNGII